MDSIIELKNVTAFRGETRALDGLSMVIRRGENTVILGPNGAGKSTLLQLFTRELYPVQEENSFVRLFGQERWNVEELRERLGIVSHDLQHRYLENTSGVRVILSGLYASLGIYRHQSIDHRHRTRAEHLMERLKITDLKNRAYGEMSTGQQRRFLLGRALINDPDTMILDEPTSSLDLKAAFTYLDIVRTLMRDGRTVVLATHHIHEIPPEIEQVVLLADGRVVDQGPKAAMLTDEKLSALFSTPVRVVSIDGYYRAVPGSRRE